MTSHHSSQKRTFVPDDTKKQSTPRNNACSRPMTKAGSVNGFSFVGQFGAFDCSIGSIFRDDFGKNLKMPKTASENQSGRALSVIVIDDSIIQRKLTMRTLGGLIDEVMWMVEGAENGERALNLIETSPRVPDVIIVDQHMETSGGHLLGHEVVAALRRNAAFDSAVIIGCTGVMDEAEAKFLEAGCDAVWSKPMPAKDVAHAQIMTFLHKRKNNTVFVGEPIISGLKTSGSFTTLNSNVFGSGGEDGRPPVAQQQQQQQQHQQPTQEQDERHEQEQQRQRLSPAGPVFMQTQPSPNNKASYVLSVATPDGSDGGSVFQFNTSPFNSSGDSVKKPFTSPRSQDLAHMTESLCHISVNE